MTAVALRIFPRLNGKFLREKHSGEELAEVFGRITVHEAVIIEEIRSSGCREVGDLRPRVVGVAPLDSDDVAEHDDGDGSGDFEEAAIGGGEVLVSEVAEVELLRRFSANETIEDHLRVIRIEHL